MLQTHSKLIGYRFGRGVLQAVALRRAETEILTTTTTAEGTISFNQNLPEFTKFLPNRQFTTFYQVNCGNLPQVHGTLERYSKHVKIVVVVHLN